MISHMLFILPPLSFRKACNRRLSGDLEFCETEKVVVKWDKITATEECEMPNGEEEVRPSDIGATKEELRPVGKRTFREVVDSLQVIKRQFPDREKQKPPPEVIAEEKALETRRDGLVTIARESGVLDDLREDIGDLSDMLAEGDLNARDIREAREKARALTETDDPESELCGVREYYYRRQLDGLARMRRSRSAKKAAAEKRGAEETEKRQEQARRWQAEMVKMVTSAFGKMATSQQGQEDLLEEMLTNFMDGMAAITTALSQFAAGTQDMVETYRGVPPDQERARWTEVERAHEFYTRFTPGMEPRFYTSLSAPERQIYNDRWQLARAAFYKKAFSASPEDLGKNPDLLLKKEQMERLYGVEGVRPALEWFVGIIINGTEVSLSDGRTMNIWACEDETDFDLFRKAMREDALAGLEEDWQKMEADAVAWNLVWVSNLLESADSRFTNSGERHYALPGAMISDDVRAVLHPQEKFENKALAGQAWGPFSQWGLTQMGKIKKKYDYNFQRGDTVVFKTPSQKDTWQEKLLARRFQVYGPEGCSEAEQEARLRTFREELEREKSFGRKRGVDDTIEFMETDDPDRHWTVEESPTIEVRAPECCPQTSLASFWDEIKANNRNLLDYLLHGDEIPWKQVEFGDPWVAYLSIKFNLARHLFEYFCPGVPMEEPMRGDYTKEREWVKSLSNLFLRLGLRGKLGERDFHNLKVWAVFAGKGGVGKPQKSYVTHPLSFKRAGWSDLAARLKMYQYGPYLERGFWGATAQIRGEKLQIR